MQWAAMIPAERWATERLFQHDTVVVPGGPPAPPGAPGGERAAPAVGDEVAVVAAGEQPQVVALARVDGVAVTGEVSLSYTRRAFDACVPAEGLTLDESLTALDADVYQRLAAALAATGDRRTWLVSLDLPIEAATPAEAVRQFWSYARELGPQELPTYVYPSGDVLAMQAFVLGAEANLDPEEDD